MWSGVRRRRSGICRNTVEKGHPFVHPSVRPSVPFFHSCERSNLRESSLSWVVPTMTRRCDSHLACKKENDGKPFTYSKSSKAKALFWGKKRKENKVFLFLLLTSYCSLIPSEISEIKKQGNQGGRNKRKKVLYIYSCSHHSHVGSVDGRDGRRNSVGDPDESRRGRIPADDRLLLLLLLLLFAPVGLGVGR